MSISISSEVNGVDYDEDIFYEGEINNGSITFGYITVEYSEDPSMMYIRLSNALCDYLIENKLCGHCIRCRRIMMEWLPEQYRPGSFNILASNLHICKNPDSENLPENPCLDLSQIKGGYS